MSELIRWGESCKLGIPLDGKLLYWLDAGDKDNLAVFARYCRIYERSRKGHLPHGDRVALYRKWLSSGHACLLAVHDGHGEIVVASVVLPLTGEAFLESWFRGLDSTHIGTDRLAPFEGGAPCRYLMVETLATNTTLAGALSIRRSGRFQGVSVRTTVCHLLTFAGRQWGERPAVMIRTKSYFVRKRLHELGFERGKGAAGNLYRADLDRRDWYSEDAQALYERCLGMPVVDGVPFRLLDSKAGAALLAPR